MAKSQTEQVKKSDISLKIKHNISTKMQKHSENANIKQKKLNIY